MLAPTIGSEQTGRAAIPQEVETMSAVLRKRIPRQETMPGHFWPTILPATMLILTLAFLLVFIGHFTPAG